MRKVTVSPHSEQWAEMFETEAQKLRQVFGDLANGIHHIGSTSVKGLAAKPIIDILVEVSNLEAVDVLNEEMIQLGYLPKGENGIPQRRYFQKGGEERTHHVHVFQEGSYQAQRHLVFRDYLRMHPEEAKRYGDLKSMLAAQYPFDIEAYMDGKDSLVKELEQAAIKWNRERQA